MKTFLRLVFLSGVLVLFSACGQSPVLSIDPQLQPMVTKFQTISSQYTAQVTITNLSAQFGTLPPDELGECILADGQTPQIIISPQAWAQAAPSDREELMFHELGHCILMRKHNSELDSNGNPVTIMNPYGVVGSIYQENSEYYQNELFKNAGN